MWATKCINSESYRSDVFARWINLICNCDQTKRWRFMVFWSVIVCNVCNNTRIQMFRSCDKDVNAFIWQEKKCIRFMWPEKKVCGAGISSEWTFGLNFKKKKKQTNHFYEPLIRVPSNLWLWNGSSFFSPLCHRFLLSFVFCLNSVCIFPVNKATFLLITTKMYTCIEAVQMKQDKCVIYLCVDLWNDLHQCQLMTTFTTTMLIHFFYSFCFFR